MPYNQLSNQTGEQEEAPKMYRRLSLLVSQDIRTRKTAREDGRITTDDGCSPNPLLVGTFHLTGQNFHYVPSDKNRRSSVTMEGHPSFSTTDTTTDYENLDQVLKLVRKRFLPQSMRVLENHSCCSQTNHGRFHRRRKKLVSDGSAFKRAAESINDMYTGPFNQKIQAHGYEVVVNTTSKKSRFFGESKHALVINVHQVVLMPTTITSLSTDATIQSDQRAQNIPLIEINVPRSPRKESYEKETLTKPMWSEDTGSPHIHGKMAFEREFPSPLFPTRQTVSPLTCTSSIGTLPCSSTTSLGASLPCIPSLDLLPNTSKQRSARDLSRSVSSIASSWSDDFIVRNSRSFPSTGNGSFGKLLFDENSIDYSAMPHLIPLKRMKREPIKTKIDRLVQKFLEDTILVNEDDVSLVLTKVFHQEEGKVATKKRRSKRNKVSKEGKKKKDKKKQKRLSVSREDSIGQSIASVDRYTESDKRKKDTANGEKRSKKSGQKKTLEAAKVVAATAIVRAKQRKNKKKSSLKRDASLTCFHQSASERSQNTEKTLEMSMGSLGLSF